MTTLCRTRPPSPGALEARTPPDTGHANPSHPQTARVLLAQTLLDLPCMPE